MCMSSPRFNPSRNNPLCSLGMSCWLWFGGSVATDPNLHAYYGPVGFDLRMLRPTAVLAGPWNVRITANGSV